MWRTWWSDLGKKASIVKVAAHRSLRDAISDHDAWLIKGNAMADKWAKAGAKLWNLPRDHLDFVSGCERIASDIVRWQSRCQEFFGELEQPDSVELSGAGDI
eukprot:4613613-Pyramimonas_sp.AAC.1